MAQNQPVRFGKYLLLEKMAAGGMAELYRAKTIGVQGLEKLIAIKKILPHLAKEKELTGSFIDEAKLAALLNHQDIVKIYDFGSMEDSYFISMEFLFGKDLRALFGKAKEKGRPLSIEYALYVMSRVCSGLDYAHKLKDFQGKPLNIIHRDISPQNVFVTYEGDVKILDFGIAKAASQSTITQYGMIKGKVAYMSPEQAAGKPVDRRSDIFSTGILLYEAVTGTRMFTGESTMQILARVREAEYAPAESVARGVPGKVFPILNRALAKDPEERYQSCGDMLADLEECMIELSMRPTARGLGTYMKELLTDEIAAEDQATRESSGTMAVGEPEREKTPEASEVSVEGVAEAMAMLGVARTEATVMAGVAATKAPEPKRQRGVLIYLGMAALLIIVIGLIVFAVQREPVPETAQKEAVVAPVQPSPPPEKTEPAAADEAKAKVNALIEQAAALVETDPEKAKSLLFEALGIDPGSVPAQLQLGRAYVKMKDYAKGIETYQKAAGAAPQSPDVYFNLGYAYAMTKDYAKAEEMYAKVVQLAPPYLDEALFNLAVMQDKLGKKKESAANLEQALSVNPKNEPAKAYLDKLKGRSKKPK
jgi:Tfp pilus assembly protein PilF/tRNA A-37 threonylcarbamoyl transferase component Bud32